MEKKEAVMMEDWIRPFSLTGMLDFSISSGEADKSSSNSFGFMDLLGLQDYYSMTTSPPPHNSIYEMLQVPAAVEEEPAFAPTTMTDHKTNISEAAEETSEVVNHQQQPTTPNSSSISSSVSSGTPLNDHEQSKAVVDHEEDDDEDEQHKMSKSQSKPKKACKKRQEREPRFAFMTKSEVDHLEDGYRWRKYGQKAVKNSAFPRSYYRCTNATCNVKKRVERCFNDPSVVMTTYEGKHTHPSPLMPRQTSSAAGGMVLYQPPPGPASLISATNFTLPMPQMSSTDHHFNYSCGYSSYTNPNTTTTSAHGQRLFRNIPQQTTLLTDRGLLQDMVVPSSFMITKQDQ